MVLLVKLVLAHLIGDFVFQPSGWVKAKEEKKLQAWQLYVHTAIHGVLIVLLTADLEFLLPAAIIMVSHGVIDSIKLIFQKESTRKIWFAIDQSLHLVTLALVWVYVEDPDLHIHLSGDVLLIITALVFITTPSSVVIKMLISQWTPTLGSGSGDSLRSAGKFIGILERLMVFTFAVSNNWAAIGFLITAKSVFRFGDLKEAHDVKLTEYVLIGTLLSFGIAIAASLLVTALR